MHWVQVQLRDILLRRPTVQLTVEGVARLVHDPIAGVHLDDRLYGLVPAVVARPRLLCERLERIDGYHVLFRHRASLPAALKPPVPYPGTILDQF
jgi:hypothetical protein